ncbi:TetR family transcriptional regulator [Pseudonocardia endophytica]|uniref:TetR family transcriptional regulator n=2 Tax=Pseudonocardia endophytica TaxID=401976 RepID=A0A4R1HZK9_PSEEN|nr:TetR family transcriptional regulator [Pseudonocardia endophytica]
MVERIVAAAEDVVAERGYDGTSTNRVATRAGVSPGSLYQYFPDKDALITEVLDRYVTALEARISAAFPGRLGPDLSPASIRGVVSELVDALAERPALLRVLSERLPRTAGHRRVAFAQRIDNVTTTALRFRNGPDPLVPVEAVAWVVVRTVEHVAISYVLEEPDLERSMVVDELCTLVSAYLRLRAAP